MFEKEFEIIINDMDLNLNEYAQRNIYLKSLSALKKQSTSEIELLDSISYEIDFLNFEIVNGELVPLNSYGDCRYPDVTTFDENCKTYLKNRFSSTENIILKNMYLIILLNMGCSNREIDDALTIINQFLNNHSDVELFSDLLLATFDKCMSFNYKRNEIKEAIIDYVNDDSYDIYSKKVLIELMISKKNIFKKGDFNDFDDLCFNLASQSEGRVKLELLSFGKRISNKIQSDKYDWNDEFGKTYEDLAESADSEMMQMYWYNKAINVYTNQEKINEISIKLRKIQLEFKLPLISFPISYEEISPIITEIFENVFFDTNEFIEYLIHSQNPFLIPDLDKCDENYNNFAESSPLLALSNQLRLDNNFNITQEISSDDMELNVVDSNLRLYSLAIFFQKIYLRELFILHHDLIVFNEDLLMHYLFSCKKFLNIPFNRDRTLLYYIEPLVCEYFKQLNAFLNDGECNFVLFIDSIVSKLELLVRKLCEIHEISLIKPQRDGSTSLMLLHDLFNDSNFKNLLFEKDYDFLKYVLLKPGLNLRNKLAHGLDLNVYNFDNANLLLLCFFRLLKYFIVVNDEFKSMSN